MKHGKSISFKKPHRAITILAMAAAVAIILFEVMPLSNPVMVESIMESQGQKTVFSSPILSEEQIVFTKIDDEHIIGNTYVTFTSSLLQQQQDPLSSLPSVNNRDSNEKNQEQQQQNPEGKISSKNKKILIVDDEPSITLNFKIALQDNGFKGNVDVYNDPIEALCNFKPNFYALLLLDVRMPKMNGFELYENIRKLDNIVKVCFMTAQNVYYMSLRELFPTVWVDSFIQKPIGLDDFVKRIREELQISDS